MGLRHRTSGLWGPGWRPLLLTSVLALVASLLAGLPAARGSAVAEAAGVVYRAVNLNGPAVSVGGVAFASGIGAPDLTAGPSRFCNQAVPLVPATDAATAGLVRCSVWGSGSPGARVVMSRVPTGTYEVSLHTWEDNASTTFSVLLNGVTVAADVVSGPAGSWRVLGPFPVSVSGGSLTVSTTGGAANLSGLVVRSSTTTSTNRPPTVTSPGPQSTVRGTAVAPLRVVASDPDVGQALRFSATGLPAGLRIDPATGTISGTPTTAQTTTVTVTAADDGTPVATGSATFSWTVTAPAAGVVYRAVNLNGPAVSVGGVAFASGIGAPDLTAGPSRFCNQAVPLVPETDAATAGLVRCSVWGSGSPGARVVMSRVPTGTYEVSLHTWEDNASTTFSVLLNGVTVAADVVSGPAGSWRVLGPFPVSVSGGSLTVSTTGGAANLSALVVRSTGGTTPPSGFDPTKVTDTFVAGGGWTRAVSADWLPNGNMLVLTQGGRIYDVTPSTGAQRLLLDLTAKVNDAGEAGSLDILVDPPGTGFWVYYTVQGSDRLRISHFTVGSSTERVIWTNPGLGYDVTHPYHVGGSLNLGPDGKLYLSVGDRVEGRSNELTNVFGKILRINTDGTVPADNPFADGAGPNVDELWAIGLRNPYRASFDEATGTYWVGDVGGNTDSQAYEEVDIVEAGKRYGWPTCEGPLGPPKSGPVCPAGVIGPVHSYGHDVDGGCCKNRAIVGGEVYRGSVFPLSGHYLYADYPTDTFSWVRLGADGRTAVADGVLTTTTARTPVWLGVGPDGHVYWLSLGFAGDGQLRRLGYSGTVDVPPTITAATATPRSGAAPLTVTFAGAATDSDGTPVTYAWDFGDGTSSSSASPSHTYPTNGTFSARLQVSSGGRTVSSDPIPIAVGAPPTTAITSPADGTTFTAGRTFTLTGTAQDPDTGPLSGSALSWDVQFLHNEHSHPAATGTGATLDFTVPSTGHDFAGDTRYRVTLTARDPDGLTATTSIVLRPVKAGVAVSSNAAGSMTVDNITQTLPHTIDTLVGFSHSVSVPASQCVAGRLWGFTSWTDGGARTHSITASAGLGLVATYAASEASCATAGTLRVSLSPSRTGARDLAGATLARTSPVYVFLDPGTQTFSRVEFWLDQPVTAPPRQVESLAPYDLAGGGATTANAFDPAGLAPGQHTVTVRVTRAGGATEVTSSTFTVT